MLIVRNNSEVRPMKVNDSKLLKFIDLGLELAKAIPRHFSKFSKRIYNNHQHIVLLVLKQKLRTTYRDLIEWLKANETVRLMLGLNRIPHRTTLIKFAKRINPMWLTHFLPARKAKKIAVDGSGFETETASNYFKTKWNGDRRQKRKFVKLSIAIDLGTQKILDYRIHHKCVHDTMDFIPLLQNMETHFVLADKGYDSRKNRKFVYQELGATPIIPFRNRSSKYGYYQRKAFKDFDEILYRQRPLVETVFSVIKRKFGFALRSKRNATQEIELIAKIIAYNIDKESILFYAII